MGLGQAEHPNKYQEIVDGFKNNLFNNIIKPKYIFFFK